jgi:hypothetical protein
MYSEMRRHNAVLEDLAAFKDVYQLWATVAGQPEPVDGILASGNFYTSLGARVEAARAIMPSDDEPGVLPVAIISDGYRARPKYRIPKDRCSSRMACCGVSSSGA